MIDTAPIPRRDRIYRHPRVGAKAAPARGGCDREQALPKLQKSAPARL
jgi:hypothetical protein